MQTIILDHRHLELAYENQCLLIRHPEQATRSLPLKHVRKVICSWAHLIHSFSYCNNKHSSWYASSFLSRALASHRTNCHALVTLESLLGRSCR